MSLRHAAGTRLAPTILVSSCIVTVAAAQQPTPEQISAIRGSCRSNFMSRCSCVQPGGAEAFACLQRNAARLSPDCRTSLAAVADPAASAAGAPPVTAQAAPAAGPAGPGLFPLRRAIRERMMGN